MPELKTLGINEFHWVIETAGYEGYTIEVHVSGVETRKKAKGKLNSFLNDVKRGDIKVE